MAIDKFVSRHIGPLEDDIKEMLKVIGVQSLDELIDQTVPSNIRLDKPLNLSNGLTEREYFRKILKIAQKNKVFNTYIGMGWYDTITPSVILRNILENPVWYTSYTPYQAEISQGRLEALLNFQTMVCELTAMPLANSSLLDEATAAAEAMHMMYSLRTRAQEKTGANICFVDELIWPQTLDVLITRAEPLGIELKVGNFKDAAADEKWFGAIVQYPNSNGEIEDYADFTKSVQQKGCKVAVATDLLALALLTPPGEWGADIVFGSSQRFGVSMGYGGPVAAFFATRDEYKRDLPGRIIGVSKDINGKNALRLALQTREQHIKRDKATSNICTAQALLATMAGMYAVYHGPEGIQAIAERVHNIACLLSSEITKLGYKQVNKNYFDTIRIDLPRHVKREDIEWLSIDLEMNFRYFPNGQIGLSIDETTNIEDINWIVEVFAKAANKPVPVITSISENSAIDVSCLRKSKFLRQHVFSKYRSETEMARYIKRLEKKDISLVHSMISLGSCTMKLNAATEMLPLSWIEFNGIHPFVPKNQAMGIRCVRLVDHRGRCQPRQHGCGAGEIERNRSGTVRLFESALDGCDRHAQREGVGSVESLMPVFCCGPGSRLAVRIRFDRRWRAPCCGAQIRRDLYNYQLAAASDPLYGTQAADPVRQALERPSGSRGIRRFRADLYRPPSRA